jgi:hypothetical protein
MNPPFQITNQDTLQGICDRLADPKLRAEILEAITDGVVWHTSNSPMPCTITKAKALPPQITFHGSLMLEECTFDMLPEPAGIRKLEVFGPTIIQRCNNIRHIGNECIFHGFLCIENIPQAFTFEGQVDDQLIIDNCPHLFFGPHATIGKLHAVAQAGLLPRIPKHNFTLEKLTQPDPYLQSVADLVPPGQREFVRKHLIACLARRRTSIGAV